MGGEINKIRGGEVQYQPENISLQRGKSNENKGGKPEATMVALVSYRNEIKTILAVSSR